MFAIYSIEGNIGSGKSTILLELRKKYANEPNVVFLDEPVEEWIKVKDEKGKNILEKYYDNQEKYAFSFQMLALITRLKIVKEAVKNNNNGRPIIIITERCLQTDYYIFAKLMLDTGRMDSIELQIYLQLYNEFTQEYPTYGIIFINTPADICLTRIGKRGRECEKHMSLDYLVKLETKYSEYMSINTEHCLWIDGSIDNVVVPNAMEEWLQQIDMLLFHQ